MQQQPSFTSVMYTSCDFATFDEKKYFINFHHFELFDETKEYCKTNFKFDYGKGLNNYRFCLYEFQDLKISNNDVKKKYVVASEILNRYEKQELAKYCYCKYHQADENAQKHMTPFDYFCLNDCDVDEDFCDQKVIGDSKERKKLGLLTIKPVVIKPRVNQQNEQFPTLYVVGFALLVSAGVLYCMLS